MGQVREGRRMTLEDLRAERERLLKQRIDILWAMTPAVLASDLDETAREALREAIEQDLDDAFFGLIEPVESEIAERERTVAFRRMQADIVDLRARQR